MTYSWVIEHRELGLSLSAFWWSVLGDLLLRSGYGLALADSESLSEVIGTIDAVIEILTRLRAGLLRRFQIRR